MKCRYVQGASASGVQSEKYGTHLAEISCCAEMLQLLLLLLALAVHDAAPDPDTMLLMDGENLHLLQDDDFDDLQILDRHKRYLMNPPNSVFQLTFLYAMPFELMRNRNLAVVLGAQIFFDLPNNITRLTVQDIGRLQLAQPSIFRSAELILDQKGIPGRQCMLLAVCELAQTPLEREAGLLEDILHLLLTPSEGSNPDDWSSGSEHEEYLKAEHTGRDESSPCLEAYPDCPYSLLSAFTKIMFT